MRYDYFCAKCALVFEHCKRMSDPAPPCVKCGGEVDRYFTPADALPTIFPGRPTWTYKDALLYKTATYNGTTVKIDPLRHGDLTSWDNPGETVKK